MADKQSTYWLTSFLWNPRLLDGEYLKVWTTRAGAEAEINSLPKDVRSKCGIHETSPDFIHLEDCSVDGQLPARLQRQKEA
jgi:hypothetical protein